jgi:beta-glucosidase
MVIVPDGVVRPGEDVEKNQMGEEFYPEALGGTIRHAAEVTGIPVIVTENGYSTTDDARRLEYFRRALRCVVDSLKSGIDVRGYFAWSAFDNFEWNSGYRPKFGIIAAGKCRPHQPLSLSGRKRFSRSLGGDGVQDSLLPCPIPSAIARLVYGSRPPETRRPGGTII